MDGQSISVSKQTPPIKTFRAVWIHRSFESILSVKCGEFTGNRAEMWAGILGLRYGWTVNFRGKSVVTLFRKVLQIEDFEVFDKLHKCLNINKNQWN